MKLYFNAQFYENNSAKAILVNHGKIEKIYHKIPKLYNVKLIDLEKTYVYPGFIDTHTHSFEGGLSALGCNLEDVSDLKEVFAKLSETKPVGGMIFAFHLDETLIKEKRLPNIDELDKLFPDTPIILRRVDGHSCSINSIAAKKISWDTPLPNNFNGILRKRWNDTAANWFLNNLDEEAIIKAYQNASDFAKQQGHTTIHTMVGDGRENPEHFKLIQHSKFDVEFILYPQITSVETAMELNSPRVGGCILADGSFGSHTAALSQPYIDQPENKGFLYHSNDFWEIRIRKAHENNMQFAVHCIGDAAIDQILTIYEKVQREDPKDLRHEIIHNELTTDEMIERMANANVSAVMQPMFDRLWAGENGLYQTVLGKERTLSTNRLKSIINKGILLTGGSDWYVTDLDPLKGINAAVNMHNPNERLAVKESIKIYTENAAKLSFDENRLGKIKEGYQADFTCLEKDLLNETAIDKVKVKFVIKNGNVIY